MDALVYQFTTKPHDNGFTMIPDCCVNILIKCSKHSPALLVSGVHDITKYIQLDPNTTYFGFKPCSIGMVNNNELNIDISALVNKTLTVANSPYIRDICNDLHDARRFNDKIHIFQEDIIPRLSNSNYAIDLAEYIYLMLRAAQGNILLKDIKEAIGFSDRYGRRQFIESMGISMKKCCRFFRLQKAIRDIVSVKKNSFVQIANSAGYFDQSHFSAEFKKFMKLSPYKFQKIYTKMFDDTYVSDSHDDFATLNRVASAS